MRQVRVEFPDGVLAEVVREAEARFPKESGGVLLGHRYNGGSGPIRVCEQIGPGPKARHESHRFEPDGEWQAERIGERYARSGRTLAYLGDWHSHPHGGGAPSALDRSTARRIARCAEARAPHPLIAILFGEPHSWQLLVYRRERWRLRRVTIANDG